MPRDLLGKSVAQLELTDEQRRWLGLADSESVRVLQAGARTILLERSGATSAEAFPWDRDLVLTGDVRAFSIADILNLLHAASKSGFFFFEHGDHAKSVYLHRGEVVFATSNQTVDRLGECLLRCGTITAAQLRETQRAYTSQGQFGKLLVERGHLTPRELWDGVKVQVEEIVRSLFSYGAGTVFFWEGEVRPDNVVRLSLPTRRLIAEGLRRRDELLSFLAWLEDPRVRVQPVQGAEAELAGAERAMMEALQASSEFSVACRVAELDPLAAARTIQLMRLLGVVDVVRPEERAGIEECDVRHSDDDAVRECVALHVKLLAELAAPIVAVEGGEGVRERLSRVTEETARRFPEILSEIEPGANAVFDPEKLIGRALRYPGEREREVRLALGELVSYLEFELLNHPKIDDPEDFLEAIDGLRARL